MEDALAKVRLEESALCFPKPAEHALPMDGAGTAIAGGDCHDGAGAICSQASQFATDIGALNR